MKLEWGLTAGNAEGEVDRLLAVSRKAEGGLPLTEAQARAVAQAHSEALRRTGRIEFGKSAAEKLVEIFAGSPWLTREEQGQQLAELAALFYDCRAELPDSLPDGWLLEQMRRAFDGPCRGCMELMNDCFLLQPAPAFAAGRPPGGFRMAVSGIFPKADKQKTPVKPALRAEKSPRPVACMPAPGSNSPDQLYRTASLAVYSPQTTLSTGILRNRHGNFVP